MRRIRYLLLGCACAGTLAVAPTASAEPHEKKVAAPAAPKDNPPDQGEPEAVAKERARTLFEKGVTAYREGRFYDAVDIFLETNRLYPDPKLSYNIGKAFEGLGSQPGALRYYREYLRRLPDAPDAREVDGHVHQLEQALGQKGLQQLTVISKPEGAILHLDGQAVGVTPWTGESFAGKHRVVLESTGYQRREGVLELDLHRARDFEFELQAEPPQPSSLTPLATTQTHSEGKISVLTLSTLASGVALLGTALISQVAGGGDSAGVSRTAAFFAGAGAGVSVLGGVMLYFDLDPTPGSKASGVSFGAGLEHGGH